MTIGWKLHAAERDALLARYPPVYGKVVADHVTLQSDHGAGTPELPPPAHARIIGCADDGTGCQAMVVEVAGTSERPTGGTYHITWSLGEGRHARDSNEVIATHGFAALDDDMRITLDPRAWGSSLRGRDDNAVLLHSHPVVGISRVGREAQILFD